MSRSTLLAVALVLATPVAAPLAGQQRPGGPPNGQPPAANARPDSAARPGAPARGPRPYKTVITDKAKSDPGLFTVHQVGETWYYEIPLRGLEQQEFLLTTRIANTAGGIGYGGELMNEAVIRWERRGDKVYVRQVQYDVVADPREPISKAVAASNFEPVIAAFDVAAYSADSANVVIDVTPMFAKDVALLGLANARRTQYRVTRFDDARSFVTAIRSYPRNIEARAVQTYAATNPPSRAASGTISVEMNHSMLLLPERPMMPRLYDERVGFFTVTQQDFGRPEQRAVERRYLARWRLEPRDTAAFRRGELVEPVKPIVFYIDPATPMKWRKALKQGVEDWQPAFEAAGFRNAILAKDPPSPAEDPEFSLEDARYSVIRYFASDIQNAYGPHVSDPRTGEILESHIGWYHNVQNLLRNWFLIQTAAVNPAARGVEFDDAVMGELIRFVSAHEVGHTLGLPHNMKASASYPVDSLRKPGFVQRMGVAPSIMDYARFNYVAQPGDGDVGLMPVVGPYDKYSIMWGYRPILDATTPDEEKPELDRWILSKAGDPMYRFGDPSPTDYESQTEAVGDDPVYASRLGIENLKRILPKLPEWAKQPGEDHSQLTELFGQVAGQWTRYMGHVATVVGGVTWHRRSIDQPGPVYEVVPRATQKAALAFIGEQAFQTPSWMLERGILDRIEHAGMVHRLRQLQGGVLNNVLSPSRLARVSENEAKGPGGYPLAEMLADVRGSVWTELRSGKVPDIYRRGLQRAYLERMDFLLNDEPPAIPPQFARFFRDTPVDGKTTDYRALVRGELETLRTQLTTAAAQPTTTAVARAHYRDAAVRIARILDPKVAKPAAPAPTPNAQALRAMLGLDTPAWPGDPVAWPADLPAELRELLRQAEGE